MPMTARRAVKSPMAERSTLWLFRLGLWSTSTVSPSSVAVNPPTLESGMSMGPNACIYDHDHDFRAGLDELRFKTAPVVIGKNCWIAAGTVILMGTTIGDNCMIGAGCILKGNIPANSVVTQKRETVIRPWEVRA